MFNPPAPGSSYQVYTAVITNDDQTQSFYPFLLPPSYPSNTNTDQTLSVADIYGPNALSDSSKCGLALGASADNNVFSLAWDTTNPNAPIAKITIAAALLWDTAPTARQQLQTAYQVFLQQLETLETSGCLNRGGAAVVALRVVESLPMQLTEILSFYYGLQTTQGTNYVDIQPGMRLRVENAASQFITPGSAFNGFITNSANYYNIQLSLTPAGQEYLSFDSFLGTLTPPSIASGADSAGGIIDFQGQNMGRRRYRLFYPSQFPASNTSGVDSILQNVTLIGADNLADIQTATTDYVSKKGCSTTASGQPIICLFFRGRSIVVPEILIYLNGAPTYVPLGTTLRQLTSRIMVYPFNPFNTANLGTNNAISMQRLGLNSSGVVYSTLGFDKLPAGSVLPSGALDMFDIPVVQGDRCSIVAAGS